jgi:hypothetical protein
MKKEEKIIDNLNWRLSIQEAKDVFEQYKLLPQTKQQKEKLFDCLFLEEKELLEILSEKAKKEGFEYTSIHSLYPILEWLYQGKLDYIMDLKPSLSNTSSHAKFLNFIFNELGLD